MVTILLKYLILRLRGKLKREAHLDMHIFCSHRLTECLTEVKTVENMEPLIPDPILKVKYPINFGVKVSFQLHELFL